MTETPDPYFLPRHSPQRPHLLRWESGRESLSSLYLENLAFHNNALVVNYREKLSQRLAPEAKFLRLDLHLDRELEALKNLCLGVREEQILLLGFDCFLTYLKVRDPDLLALFWSNLEKMRKLPVLLWIVIPDSLIPPNWSKERIFSPLNPF